MLYIVVSFCLSENFLELLDPVLNEYAHKYDLII